MYVNDRTLNYGDDGREAIRKILDMGYERGIIPHKANVDFVGYEPFPHGQAMKSVPDRGIIFPCGKSSRASLSEPTAVRSRPNEVQGKDA